MNVSISEGNERNDHAYLWPRFCEWCPRLPSRLYYFESSVLGLRRVSVFAEDAGVGFEGGMLTNIRVGSEDGASVNSLIEVSGVGENRACWD